MVDFHGTPVALSAKSNASSGVSKQVSISPTGAVVLSPYKYIDLRDYGFSESASAATNTTAFTTALTAAQSAKVSIFLADGDYAIDNTVVTRVAHGSQISIFSNPGRGARLNKTTSDGNGLFQVGTATPTGYTALLRFSNISFNGIAGNSAFAFRGYDMARCMFDNCQFTASLIGLDLKGGIGNSFYKCNIDGNTVGLNVKKYTGGYDGWPNLNTFDQCQIINNTEWGIDFDDGRMLIARACDIEGNGTSGNASTGGVRSGASAGSQGGLVSPGFQALSCWFEANAGNSAVQWAAGKTTLKEQSNLTGTNW